MGFGEKTDLATSRTLDLDTCKSKDPDALSALKEAKEILETLDPHHTSIPKH